MKNSLDSRTLNREQIVHGILLIGLIASPHFFNIHTNVVLAFYFMISWKLASQWFKWIPTNRWLIIFFAIVFFSVSAWHYGPPLGRDPGVSFLIVLLGLKSLECRSRRDLRILLILGYFIVITHFLYLNNLPIVFLLFLSLIGLTVMLMQMGHAEPSGKLKSDIRLSVRLFVIALPFMAIMFFLFPRFAGGLWLLKTDSSTATTGMSSTLTMGAISRLVGSDEEAFTATFPDGKLPPPEKRYWRTGVLWHTDGREWFPREQTENNPHENLETDDLYFYEMEVAPSRNRWLHALDLPLTASQGIQLTSDYFLKPKNGNSIHHYDVSSTGVYSNKNLDDNIRGIGTALAGGMVTERLGNLVSEHKALSLIGNNVDNDQYATQTLRYFREKPFSYTLTPPLLTSDTPVDEFLFSTRQGFCEHYAASFVTLMRAAEIPARIVIGYLGGRVNPLTNQITVIQSDAHAWAEYWSERYGWRRVDPTVAVSPDRIESGINFELSIGSNGRVQFLTLDLGLLDSMLREIRWYGELVEQNWKRWFVGFDYKRQQTLLSNIGLDRIPFRSLALFAFLLSVGVLLVGITISFVNERQKKVMGVAAFDKFCSKAEKVGLARSPVEGPANFVTRCIEKFPHKKSQLDEIADLYLALRYGPNPEPGLNTDLKTRIRNFEFS